MFKDKGGKTVETKLVIEVKIVDALINMIHVHGPFKVRQVKNRCSKIENQKKKKLQLTKKKKKS
jgi:hypothetical protein